MGEATIDYGPADNIAVQERADVFMTEPSAEGWIVTAEDSTVASATAAAHLISITDLGARALGQLMAALEKGAGEQVSELDSRKLVVRRPTVPSP